MHPLQRIPDLPPDAPAILTAQGALLPHRSILFDNPLLLLHHATHGKAEHTPAGELSFDEAFLAGIAKTATRIAQILKPLGGHGFQLLQWPTPERMVFTTKDDISFAEYVHRRNILEQAETLRFCWHGENSFLIFRRC